MQRWHRGGTQHDIRDFFEHLMSRCQVYLLSMGHGKQGFRRLDAAVYKIEGPVNI